MSHHPESHGHWDVEQIDALVRKRDRLLVQVASLKRSAIAARQRAIRISELEAQLLVISRENDTLREQLKEAQLRSAPTRKEPTT